MKTNPHELAASVIVPKLMDKIGNKKSRYIISIAGESGCGKTETAKALVDELKKNGKNSLLLGQDNYFYLPPLANDLRRKTDPAWLGPHKEVNLALLEKNIQDALDCESEQIVIPHIEYDTNVVSDQSVDLRGIDVLVVEGTYTSLLKYVDTKIFIDENYHDTLKFRKLRNRGNEVNDEFVEGILETEHKIIAGQIFLADIILTKDYEVIEK